MKKIKVILDFLDDMIKEKELIINGNNSSKEDIEKAKEEKDLYVLIKALLWFEYAFSKIVLDSIKFKKKEDKK